MFRFPHSVGLRYSGFTYFLGFKVNSGECKLMGLVPYGDLASKRVAHFERLIIAHIVDIAEDGSIWLNPEFFTYSTSLKMVNKARWKALWGIERRIPESEITHVHSDLALAIQRMTEQIVLRMARKAKRLTGSRYLSLGVGAELNCMANGKLLRTGGFGGV